MGQSALRWGGKQGRTLKFDAVTISNGTSPEGSTWRKNPVPRAWKDSKGNWGVGSNQFQTGMGFQPVCEDNGEDKIGNAYSCTSEWGPYNMEIVDQVVIPSNLKPGPYVVGFRWDCGELMVLSWRV